MSIPQTTREYRLPKADGFHNLTLTSSPIPALKATEVLVKVHAVSLQYRDLVVAKGTYPLGQKDNLVPGSDLAGEVVAVGAEAAGWAVGDRVASNFATDHIFGEATAETKETGLGAPIDGVLTEYKVLPAHALVRIPEHLSYEEASTLPCAAVTAYNALLGPNPLKGGDVVLVQGTGGVSIFGLQLAVASGATVIVTSSSDEKLKIAKSLGATHIINYKTTPNWDEEALKITNGRGVDHILEVGGPGTIIKSANAIRYGGTISIIGFIAGQADVSTLPLKILGKAAVVRGILVGSRTQFEDMNRLITAVQLKPVVDKVFAFEELRKAYEYQESQQHVGKVVVKVSRD
ncbi:NAD-P-binding protein [Trametes versicolor FP-101664 SS1]|uniref:NAD-P-binding protein n=1 Tax=Trametes versicolor (strain FP-101664) TaxID=717944 RepID=UPI0004621B0A|nr:NAD-P-binding protein [Trametes versicolor FP-101664 SS1]EIW56493.1 NAD-P-binding protein [Trametes versicolor FP-101664 SS1]